ncbi:MAG: NAD(P)/FAD-dependent oxidoreductase [Nitrospinota bacterium]
MARMQRLKKKVVIIGGGFGGIFTAKHLDPSRYEVVIVDKTNHHLFQPLLYQVATAALSPADIAIPIRKILRKKENTLVLMCEATSIDKKKKTVSMKNHADITYDILVVATGASHSYFGNPQWEELAPGLKTLDDALTIRERILESFERAEMCDSYSSARKFLNFIIIGAGPTGVELAGSIAEIANHTLLENFKRIDPTSTRVYLLEGGNQVLPTMPKKLGDRAKADLERLGIQVVTGNMVTDLKKSGVQVGNQFIESCNIIWAAGNVASPLLKSLDEELDRAGRVIVSPELTIPGFDEIFVIGDAAHSKDKDANPLPGVAPVAIQQAKYVVNTLNKMKEKPIKPFSYIDRGSMATIGRFRAVAKFGNLEFAGFSAWLTWSFVHLLNLVLYRNRFRVFFEWGYSYVTGQRGARIIRRPFF